MNNFESVPLDKIKIGDRFRKDLGDLDALAQSIKEIGLLHPPVVNERYELVAGHRRIEACKLLGWKEIPVHVVNIQSAIDGEIQENSVRKDFAPSEMVGIKRNIEQREKELAGQRMLSGKPCADSAGGTTRERTAEIVSRMCGSRFSHDYLSKAEKIVDAAERHPEMYRDLLKLVDEGKISVNRAYKKIIVDGVVASPKSEARPATKKKFFCAKYPHTYYDNDTNRYLIIYQPKWLDTDPKLELYLSEHATTTDFWNYTNTDGKGAPLLGLTAGEANQILLSPHNTIVAGISGRSGKTTCVEGVVSRWLGKKIIVFITKRGETCFKDYQRIKPFLTQRADWQYVMSLIESELQEKASVMRTQVIEACRGASALSDVWHNVRNRLDELQTGKGRNSFDRSMLVQLDATLEKIVPHVEKYYKEGTFSSDLSGLEEGISVMDLTGFPIEMQQMIIGSVAAEVMAHHTETVLVIPEAWEMLPHGRGSPAKMDIEVLMRKGRVLGNYVVLDSQDITGIDPRIRKQVGNYILGRQTELNEVSRTLDQIPLPQGEKPKAHEVQMLELGHFIAVIDGKVHKVYSIPSWQKFDDAVDCAMEAQ